MILLLDNYDSFTYNLFQYLGELGADVEVVRNDATTPEAIFERRPAGLVISPGPCTPNEAGISIDLIRANAARAGDAVPLLGVCLGHQCIGQAFGGEVVRAREVMHGKTSKIVHEGRGVFADLPNPFLATRYHSLIVDEATMPQVLRVTARTEDGVIMGVEHTELPIVGVQFHPESVLTASGKGLLANFLRMAGLAPRPIASAA